MELTSQTLIDAASRFALRSDDFAAGKAEICADLAAKLERFGTFASERQYEFACKLVQWSLPRAPRAVAPALAFPNVERLVREKNLSLHLGECKVVLFSSGVLGIVSPLFGAGTYGVIEQGGNFRRFASCTDAMVELLKAVETRGIEAVKEIGKATGRCCVCSRMLTDEVSIQAGIGPICASKF